MAKTKRRYSYGTYRFGDKDPVFDILRMCAEIMAVRMNIPREKWTRVLPIIERSGGPTASCTYGWFFGDTRTCRHDSMMAFVHATGREATVAGKLVGTRPRFKVAASR